MQVSELSLFDPRGISSTTFPPQNPFNKFHPTCTPPPSTNCPCYSPHLRLSPGSSHPQQRKHRTDAGIAVGSEVVLVDDIAFPKEITPTATSKPLLLVGHGITDIEIHFLQIKFTAIGVYVDRDITSHLQAWKGKTEAEISAEGDSFFDNLVEAPVEKFIRVVTIKELKGAQYSLQLESTVRDRLAEIDRYEEEEEKTLEKIVEFFQGKYLKKNSVISYHFPASSKTVEVGFVAEGKGENEAVKLKVENQNVAGMIQRWYLGGSRAVSPSTVASLANGVATLLQQ